MSLLPRGYLDTTVAIEAVHGDGEAMRYTQTWFMQSIHGYPPQGYALGN